MFKNFNISTFKKMKPPGDNTFDTMQELKELKSIPINKKFVKDNDNIEEAFKKVAEKNKIKDYDTSIAAKLIKTSAPIILELKKHFNRPRPKVVAKKMNIDMKDIEMDSMKIAKVLSDKYPKAKTAFAKKGKDISYSRRVAHAHYKSDSKMGEKLGDKMYNYIKNKV